MNMLHWACQAFLFSIGILVLIIAISSFLSKKSSEEKVENISPVIIQQIDSLDNADDWPYDNTPDFIAKLREVIKQLDEEFEQPELPF